MNRPRKNAEAQPPSSQPTGAGKRPLPDESDAEGMLLLQALSALKRKVESVRLGRQPG